MTTIFCYNIVQTCEQYVLIWEWIYFCVSGYSVLKFWGTDKFFGSRLGALANKIPLLIRCEMELHSKIENIFSDIQSFSIESTKCTVDQLHGHRCELVQWGRAPQVDTSSNLPLKIESRSRRKLSGHKLVQKCSKFKLEWIGQLFSLTIISLSDCWRVDIMACRLAAPPPYSD